MNITQITFFFLLFLSTWACSSDSNDDPIVLPNITVQSVSIEEGSDEKPLFVDFRLDQSSDDEVRFMVSTENGTAIAGEDYVEIIEQEVVIRPGSSREDVRISILGDADAENDEVFYLNIFDIEGAAASSSRVDITIENDDLETNYVIPQAGYITPEQYPGMTKIWSDEFDGQSLDMDTWTFETGNGRSGWGNNELQFYQTDNTDLYEGHLVIQAREESFGGFRYTSSRIITKDKFEFTHGRVDIRAALPEGQGIWPALWMLGANISEVRWPRCGEIDIMEIVGHKPSTLHGTVHYANPDGVHLYKGDSLTLNTGSRFSGRFHVFSIIWSEDKIEWYLDDQKYFTVTPEILGTANPYPFNEPFFFIFNVAVGGNWPGPPDGSTQFPQNMFVDYIRVFQ